jgi:L-fucose isomerase-like protein
MPARVALVVISNHAFIPSFAQYHVAARGTRESYIGEVRKDSVDFLSACGIEVILDEWVHDVDSARTIASKLKQIDFDLLVFTVPIWPGGDSVLELAKAVANVPLVVWTPVTPLGHLCGYFEVTSDLRSLGIRFEPVFGKTREAKEQIRRFAKAAMVVKKLHVSRVAQIGYTPHAYVDVTASELDLRARFGLEIAHLDISEVHSETIKVTEEEAEEVESEFRKKVGEMKMPEKDLLLPAKICRALDKIIVKYKLNGYALSCSPMNFEIAFPCLALSKSTEEGVVGSCEGDLPSAIMLLILHEIAGKAPAVLDIDSGEIEKNIVNLWHCGHLAMSLAESPSDIAITPPLYDGEVMGPGAVLFFPIKQGKVTLANLSGKGDRMFIASGEALRLEKKKGSGGYSEVRLDSNLVDTLRIMAENGVGHHLCMVHEDIKGELIALCKILGIQSVIC